MQSIQDPFYHEHKCCKFLRSPAQARIIRTRSTSVADSAFQTSAGVSKSPRKRTSASRICNHHHHHHRHPRHHQPEQSTIPKRSIPSSQRHTPAKAKALASPIQKPYRTEIDRPTVSSSVCVLYPRMRKLGPPRAPPKSTNEQDQR